MRIFLLLLSTLVPEIALAEAPLDAGVDVGTATPTFTSPAAAIWGAIKAPGSGHAQAIGGYSAGCLDGASKLPFKGGGWNVARPERGRVYGHPALIAFIVDTGKKLLAAKLAPLPIGDLAQPRGGPAPTGHASHQTGLDVDIGYATPGSDGKAVALVDLARNKLHAKWDAAVTRTLALVVGNPSVDRVFVNPVIKQTLCSLPGDHAWLRKIRPWYGHHDHFHVRLRCPEDSPACQAQADLPEGDGCGELAWWLKPNADREKGQKTYKSKVGASPVLPLPCSKLVETPTTSP